MGELSKKVENTVGKREIARYKQFLLFPQCFQQACFPEASKGVIVWEWVNQSPASEGCKQLKGRKLVMSIFNSSTKWKISSIVNIHN